MHKSMKIFNCCFLSLALLLLLTNCDTSTGSTEPSETRYKPGTYTSSAVGFVSDIKVSVAFSEEKITGITIDEHHETTARNTVAFALEHIPDSIVQSQSVDVDIVSGATYTSEAIKEAVKNCVSQAMAP
jgi:fumarate reductase flavoprotein subunit